MYTVTLGDFIVNIYIVQITIYRITKLNLETGLVTGICVEMQSACLTSADTILIKYKTTSEKPCPSSGAIGTLFGHASPKYNRREINWSTRSKFAKLHYQL